MNFLNYLLKAKGRHGTHSPYIYSFVEEALHEKVPDRDYPREIKGSKARTLFRVLSYLANTHTQQLTATPGALQAHGWLQHFNPVVTVPDQMVSRQRGLFVLNLEEMDLHKDVFLIKGMEEGSVLLVLHPGSPRYALLEGYFRQECFNVTIFTWNFSVLMHRPDFKRKQHFILR